MCKMSDALRCGCIPACCRLPQKLLANGQGRFLCMRASSADGNATSCDGSAQLAGPTSCSIRDQFCICIGGTNPYDSKH